MAGSDAGPASAGLASGVVHPPILSRIVILWPTNRFPLLMAIVAVGCLVLAVFFGVLAFTTWRADSALSERGVTTTSSVLVSDYAPGGTSSITVGFKDAAGSPHQASIDVANSPAPIGTAMTITYDPQDPSRLRLAGADASQNMGAGGWAGIASLFGAIAAAAFVVRVVLKKRAPRAFGGSAANRP